MAWSTPVRGVRVEHPTRCGEAKQLSLSADPCRTTSGGGKAECLRRGDVRVACIAAGVCGQAVDGAASERPVTVDTLARSMRWGGCQCGSNASCPAVAAHCCRESGPPGGTSHVRAGMMRVAGEDGLRGVERAELEAGPVLRSLSTLLQRVSTAASPCAMGPV